MQPESWRLDRWSRQQTGPLLRVPHGTVESHVSVNDVQLIAARSPRCREQWLTLAKHPGQRTRQPAAVGQPVR